MRNAFVVLLSVFIAGNLGAAQATGIEAAPQEDSSSINVKNKLPYGVEDVLKLSRAEVNENVIVKYIRNTGTVYNLAPETIVYLKDQGVSDTVLNAMLDQPKNVARTTSTWASQAPAQVPRQQAAPQYIQPPQPDPAPPAPAPQPRSTLHIIPYYPATYDYYYRPGWPGYYYRPYWYGPSISLGFGFGFGHHHRGYRCW